ncbi:hypothetical protein [Albirhodobacter sp. R86504]|uniref:hypothetical protein n=1 Tax=Albirhodobacter sp. R86504 TaxID=3093848 RepID=UPI00366FD3A2
MTAIPHPLTGVLINDITEIRTRKLTDDEQLTARHLLNSGMSRQLVAATLGCHPLAINVADLPKPARNPQIKNGLRTADARIDPRQLTLLDEILGTIQKGTKD